jgi:hypothetical protein
MTEGFETGWGSVGACHGELLSSVEVELMVDQNRISI